jgi:D-amino-acid dehydrogenase
MKKKVLVIGGGIVGACSAIELAKKGASVHLLEKNLVGQACSHGSAGWLTPCFAMPLPMPGMLLQSMKWLLNPDSPLYIKPAFSAELAAWLVRFLSSMSNEKAIKSTEALVQLSRRSLEMYRSLANEKGEDFGFQERGLLMISETPAGLKSILNEVNFVGRFGVEGVELSPGQVQEKEPLIKINTLGGAYFPHEAHVDPARLMEVLKNKMREVGVQIEEHTDVHEFVVDQKRISAVKTSKGERSAELIVLATGSWSKDLGKILHKRVPIFGGKGYSMKLPKLALGQPIMAIERKLAITPHQNYLRIAGTLELVDQDFSITERRAKVLLEGAKKVLPVPADLTLESVKDLWVGLRPCTPDGVPMIGFSKQFQNVIFACGHQMLGLQSGAGTGHLVAQLAEGVPTFMDTSVFNVDRF